MAWAVAASGDEVMDGSEDDLATDTTGGDYVLYMDFNTMASGDKIEGRIYVKPKSGDTERLLYGPNNGLLFTDTQETPMAVSWPISIVAGGSIRCTLKQVAGTNRTIPWRLLQTA